jgi:antitoxin VapB
MSLNIKNERVHDLVREASRLTGQSQTSVVEAALRHYLDELARGDSRAKAERILGHLRDTVTAAGPRANIEALYDTTTGLPA